MSASPLILGPPFVPLLSRAPVSHRIAFSAPIDQRRLDWILGLQGAVRRRRRPSLAPMAGETHLITVAEAVSDRIGSMTRSRRGARACNSAPVGERRRHSGVAAEEEGGHMCGRMSRREQRISPDSSWIGPTRVRATAEAAMWVGARPHGGRRRGPVGVRQLNSLGHLDLGCPCCPTANPPDLPQLLLGIAAPRHPDIPINIFQTIYAMVNRTRATANVCPTVMLPLIMYYGIVFLDWFFWG